MSNQQLILAFFENSAKAEDAVATLKQWDRANDDIRFGAIGVLVKDADGKIKAQKVGTRAGKKGAKTLAVVGALAGVLSGGLTVVGGIVGGAVLGGALGAFFHQGLGLSKEDMARISGELDGGKAAVGLIVKTGEVAMISEALTSLGGTLETYAVTDEAVEQAVASAEAEAAPDADATKE